MDMQEFIPAFKELVSSNDFFFKFKNLQFEMIDSNKDSVVTFNEFWKYCEDFNSNSINKQINVFILYR